MKVNEAVLAALKDVVETKENKPLIQRYKAYAGSPAVDADGEELYCICRKPDEGELMVACDGCDQWFHFKCMNINSEHDKLVSSFFCLFCDELFNKGKTLWKKKCRVAECLNPIELSIETAKVSKYCSAEHGELYMRQNLLMKLGDKGSLTKEQFARVLVEVSDYRTFSQLGDTLPTTDTEKLPANVQIQISEAEAQIRNINKDQEMLQLKKAQLNNAKEKANVFNQEIFKLNSDEHEAESKSKKKKKKKDICGYDYSHSGRVEPVRGLQDLGISQEEFVEAYVNSKAEQTTEIFDTCIKEKTKCFKHSYWYEIRLDNLQNSIVQNNETKIELELKINNLIAMGWEFLENV